MTSAIPTREGLARYTTTAGYNIDLSEPIACACSPSCAPRCAGECGCEACAVQFATFCDMAGYTDVAPGSDEEASALEAYRSGWTAAGT